MRTQICLLVAALLVFQAVTSNTEHEKELKTAIRVPHTNDATILKRSLRAAYQEQLSMLEEAEENLSSQIKALQAQKSQISQRKRSHYMCLVNLITCYRKRK